MIKNLSGGIMKKIPDNLIVGDSCPYCNGRLKFKRRCDGVYG